MKQILMMLVAALPLVQFATTWCVSDATGSDSNVGTTWGAALKTIQKAIDVSVAGDEIQVAGGIYSPIVIPAGKEPLSLRATGTQENCIIDAQSKTRCVQIGSGSTTNVYVTGFTIKNGYNGSDNGGGALGGTYINCTLTKCSGRLGGGATQCVLSNCVITANTGGVSAGAAYKCILYNCMVSNNYCGDWTGGLQECTAINCLITGNSSNHVGEGGASGCTLIGCTIRGNTVVSSGGAGGCGNCKMYQCWLEGNTGGWASELNGGEAYNSVIVATGSSRIITGTACYNCTIVSSVKDNLIWRGSRMYNCVLSGNGGGLSVSGDNNWSAELKNCFLENVTVGDYVIKEGCLSGSVGFVGASDYHLKGTSPCRDAGNNQYVRTQVDYDGNGRIFNGRVDIGAFEYYPPLYNVDFVLKDGIEHTGGGALSQKVYAGFDAEEPTVSATDGYWFMGWDKNFTNVQDNVVVSSVVSRVDVALTDEVRTITVSGENIWPIVYTTNGIPPTVHSVLYTEPIVLSARGDADVWMQGLKDGALSGNNYRLTIDAPDTPAINPVSGTVFEAASLTITMSCASEGTTIHYTTNGANPTVFSPVYKKFKIHGKTTVKAVAYYEDGTSSKIAVAEYAKGLCEEPSVTPPNGTVFEHSGQVVSLAHDNPEGVLRYTIDGSDPTAESPEYTDPFTIDETTVVKAKVFGETYFDSSVVTATLTRVWLKVDAPVITASAAFTGSQQRVSLACGTEGAVVRYTTNGQDPNSHSTKYTKPFYVTDTTTVKAYAMKPDYTNSDIATLAIVKVWGIGDTMGKPDHAFATSGDAGFVRVDDATATLGESMKSGAIGNDQKSILSTTVIGPGTLTFKWKASCEEDEDYEWDHGEFKVDGELMGQINGETDWIEVSQRIEGDGEHTVTWTYVKDDVEYVAQDCIWVSDYAWASDYTETQTTEVPVPYDWLKEKSRDIVDEYENYEKVAKQTAYNPRFTVEQCYVAGLDPESTTNEFTATIGPDLSIGWKPDLKAERNYKVWGSTNLVNGGDWEYPTNALHRFFKVTVEMP